MTRKFLVIAVALAGFMAMTPGALARPIGAVTPRPVRLKLSPLDHRYLSLYHQVARRNGDRAPGRNIVRQGTRDGHPPSARHVASSVRVLERMLAPPPVAVSVPTTRITQTVAPTTPSYSGGMPACTWVPESGGSYTAQNPSGAGGKYQIMPSTWRAYGGVESNAADAPPAEQEAVARRVLAGQGLGAWVNC